VGSTVGALVSIASGTDLAAVMAGLTILVGGWGVVFEEADAVGAGLVEEVDGGVKVSVSGDVAGNAFGEVGANVAGGLTGLAGLNGSVVPEHGVAFAKIV